MIAFDEITSVPPQPVLIRMRPPPPPPPAAVSFVAAAFPPTRYGLPTLGALLTNACALLYRGR